jgi:hypothetical protein
LAAEEQIATPVSTRSLPPLTLADYDALIKAGGGATVLDCSLRYELPALVPQQALLGLKLTFARLVHPPVLFVPLLAPSPPAQAGKAPAVKFPETYHVRLTLRPREPLPLEVPVSAQFHQESAPLPATVAATPLKLGFADLLAPLPLPAERIQCGGREQVWELLWKRLPGLPMGAKYAFAVNPPPASYHGCP